MFTYVFNKCLSSNESTNKLIISHDWGVTFVGDTGYLKANCPFLKNLNICKLLIKFLINGF